MEDRHFGIEGVRVRVVRGLDELKADNRFLNTDARLLKAERGELKADKKNMTRFKN